MDWDVRKSLEATVHRESFDRYAHDYESLLAQGTGLFGEPPRYFADYKVRCIRRWCRGKEPQRIVELGCGVGLLMVLLGEAFPRTQVIGLDVSSESVRVAAQRCHQLPNVECYAYDGEALPAQAHQADLVVLANLLHHVPPKRREPLLARLRSWALRPGGRLVVFEQNPYNPVTRAVVRACPFDREAQLLHRGSLVRLCKRVGLQVQGSGYIVFFPRIVSALRRFEPQLGWLPLGGQYFVLAG